MKQIFIFSNKYSVNSTLLIYVQLDLSENFKKRLKGTVRSGSTCEHMQMSINCLNTFLHGCGSGEFLEFCLLCFSLVSLIFWRVDMPPSHLWTVILGVHIRYLEIIDLFTLAVSHSEKKQGVSSVYSNQSSQDFQVIYKFKHSLVTISAPQLVNHAFGFQAQEKWF